MDASALSKLLSPEGWALLGVLPPYHPDAAMAISERLRGEGFDTELVAAALTQSRLRAKAHEKFGDFAEGMLFTPEGLEQATRLTVAAHHAQRYRKAGSERVADLTCGIGADSLAVAGMGIGVLAVEIDELTAALATVNLRHFEHAEVRHGDGMAVDLEAEGVDAVFADPARRTRSGSRRHDPAAYAPPLDDVLALRSRVPALGVKVGPGIPHTAVPADAEAQWVSVDGTVVEAGLWFGPLASGGAGRSALVVRGETSTTLSDDGAHAATGTLGGYLYEPDGAVIRAGLVATLADRLGGHLVDPTIAYITTGTPSSAEPSLATGYRVLDSMPFNVKRLRAYLRERGVGRVTIKKRGTAVTPEALRSQLALKGDASATLVLTRIAGAQHVIVVEAL
ncbi:MAG: class I SAM-dependent methyltransferase [Actinomycetales bacterium]|nr:class I SAM-dependent methyltransferase [Actinomycetales bacterium]